MRMLTLRCSWFLLSLFLSSGAIAQTSQPVTTKPTIDATRLANFQRSIHQLIAELVTTGLPVDALIPLSAKCFYKERNEENIRKWKPSLEATLEIAGVTLTFPLTKDFSPAMPDCQRVFMTALLAFAEDGFTRQVLLLPETKTDLEGQKKLRTRLQWRELAHALKEESDFPKQITGLIEILARNRDLESWDSVSDFFNAQSTSGASLVLPILCKGNEKRHELDQLLSKWSQDKILVQGLLQLGLVSQSETNGALRVKTEILEEKICWGTAPRYERDLILALLHLGEYETELARELVQGIGKGELKILSRIGAGQRRHFDSQWYYQPALYFFHAYRQEDGSDKETHVIQYLPDLPYVVLLPWIVHAGERYARADLRKLRNEIFELDVQLFYNKKEFPKVSAAYEARIEPLRKKIGTLTARLKSELNATERAGAVEEATALIKETEKTIAENQDTIKQLGEKQTELESQLLIKRATHLTLSIALASTAAQKTLESLAPSSEFKAGAAFYEERGFFEFEVK